MSYFGRCPCCFKILDFTHLDFHAVKCLYCGEDVLKDQLEPVCVDKELNALTSVLMEADHGSRNKKEN